MLERAARHTEGWASSPWEAASGQQRRRRTARRAPSVAALGWWARRAAGRPRVSALGAPRVAIPKEIAEECLRRGSAPPNGDWTGLLRLETNRQSRHLACRSPHEAARYADQPRLSITACPLGSARSSRRDGGHGCRSSLCAHLRGPTAPAPFECRNPLLVNA